MPESPDSRVTPAPGPFDSALENLVRQFARPLDCLRELVQNGIDAGTPRIEVSLRWEPEDHDAGVLSISVRDYGEGMDEHIIDHQLTEMFASSKTGDMTKLGRFGIGFTSVFAIVPEAVHVETGRHGTSWELIFHKDRSFDKLRRQEAFKGTRVSLFKRLPTHQLPTWRRDIEAALTFWCEHCSVPVTFDAADLTAPASGEDDPTPATADPFADFEAPAAARVKHITRPLDLPDSTWQIRRTEGNIDVLVGLGSSPAYRWYNGGLTLLSTSDTACLGDRETRIGHLRFKAQCGTLEHTLTRDNVIQDDTWRQVVAVIERAAKDLERVVHAEHQAAVDSRGDLIPTLRGLSRIASHTGRLDRAQPIFFPVLDGPPTVLPNPSEPVERATSPSPVTEALHGRGITVYWDMPELRSIAAVLGVPLHASVGERWLCVAAPPTPPSALHAAVAELMAIAGVKNLSVNWCHISGTSSPYVVTNMPPEGPVLRDRLHAHRVRRMLGIRNVWLNLAHPTVALAVQLAALTPTVAAFSVLQAVCLHCDGVGSSRMSAIRKAAVG